MTRHDYRMLDLYLMLYKLFKRRSFIFDSMPIRAARYQSEWEEVNAYFERKPGLLEALKKTVGPKFVNRSEANKTWVFKIVIKKKYYSKTFPDAQYGGKELARQAAWAYAKKQLKRLGRECAQF